VWDLASSQTLRTFERAGAGLVCDVVVTPDGRRAVSSSRDRTLRLWDLESGRTLHTLEGHTDFVSGVALMPDCRRAVSSSGDRTLRVWDLESGQTLSILKGPSSFSIIVVSGRCFGLFSINVVSFSRNVVLRGALFSSNLVRNERCFRAKRFMFSGR
jgi:WD40 repeat protein